MLISHSRKFIFIHVPKVAGRSITMALLPHAAGPVATWVGRAARKIGIDGIGPRPYDDHITAMELIDRIGRARFDDYLSFAVVRNPWDWQSSLYNYALKHPGHYQHEMTKGFGSFANYLEWRCDGHYILQSDYVCDAEGRVLVDLVGRMENLEQDFRGFCSRLGLDVELPRLNVFKQKDYHEDYDDRLRDMVARTFARDIEMFGYEF